MAISTFENVSLAHLLANYMHGAHAFVQRPDPVQYQALDASFRELRSAQKQRWARGKRIVDALGAAACDLVNDPRSSALLMAHDRALSVVLEELVGAAATA